MIKADAALGDRNRISALMSKIARLQKDNEADTEEKEKGKFLKDVNMFYWYVKTDGDQISP